MAGSNVVDITHIRKGMELHAADGVKLGKITEVWLGTDPAGPWSYPAGAPDIMMATSAAGQRSAAA
jgi:hypothetical protein